MLTISRRSQGIEALRIAKAADVAPRQDERVLEDVLGKVVVTDDSMGDREQPGTSWTDQVDERRLIAPLRCFDELAVHITTVIRSHLEVRR